MSDNKYVAVVGGCGYIGSAICAELLKSDYTPVVFDDLSAGHQYVSDTLGLELHTDLNNMVDILRDKPIKTVINLAGSSIISESIKAPELYYGNNIAITMRVIEALNLAYPNLLKDPPRLIFASSAAVYGQYMDYRALDPIRDFSKSKLPLNPYGWSKRICEHLIKMTSNISYIIFRYFNVIGTSNYESTILGEWHDPETHLVPKIIEAPDCSEFTFPIYSPIRGDHFVRDYIDVTDLAKAHTRGLKYLCNVPEYERINLTLNIGSGTGIRTIDLFNQVKKLSGKAIRSYLGSEKPDPVYLVADINWTKQILRWEPTVPRSTSICNAINWHNKVLPKLKREYPKYSTDPNL